MYYSGFNGGNVCGGGCGGGFQMPYNYGGCCNRGHSSFAIILVLFILLVIVIGPRFCI